jgi:hypothetical protein
MRLKCRGLLLTAAMLAAIGCSDDDEDDTDAEKCDALLDVVVDCYDGYCHGEGTAVPFCQCWNNGQDISVESCQCIPLDLESVCQVINLDQVDPNAYNCSAATSFVSEFCN